jgi:hypothetical protein
MRKAVAPLVLGVVLTFVASAGAARADFHDIATVALSGAAEVPAGDPNGSGKVRIFYDMKEGLLCWSLTVKGIGTAFAAHIHRASAGQAGQIVVPMTPPVNGGSKGCTGTSRALIRDIAAHKDRYYVNVHTEAYPGGAIRGQLG